MKASEFGGAVPSMVGEWAYSPCEDGGGDGVWHNSTPSREAAVEEAVAEAQEDGVDPDHVYVCEGVEAEVPGVDCETLIATTRDAMYEVYGGVSDGFLSGITLEQHVELQRDLDLVFGGWLTRHRFWPTFCGVGHVEKVDTSGDTGDVR